MFLRQSYTEIERALKNQQYPSFLDYLQDIEQFKQIFEESGPPGPGRKGILLEFCLKAIMESAEFFLGNVASEMNLQRQLAEEQIRKLQQEIQEIKYDQKERIENLEVKLRKTDIEKAELSAKEQSTKEALQQMQSEKNELENKLSTQMSSLKKDYERTIDELTIKVSNTEEQKKEISRAQMSSESEFEKQKALLDQKIEFLEKAVDDTKSREKELNTELKNSKKEFLT
jgi:chromosome segregation ATPase